MFSNLNGIFKRNVWEIYEEQRGLDHIQIFAQRENLFFALTDLQFDEISIECYYILFVLCSASSFKFFIISHKEKCRLLFTQCQNVARFGSFFLKALQRNWLLIDLHQNLLAIIDCTHAGEPLSYVSPMYCEGEGGSSLTGVCCVNSPLG